MASVPTIEQVDQIIREAFAGARRGRRQALIIQTVAGQLLQARRHLSSPLPGIADIKAAREVLASASALAEQTVLELAASAHGCAEWPGPDRLSIEGHEQESGVADVA